MGYPPPPPPPGTPGGYGPPPGAPGYGPPTGAPPPPGYGAPPGPPTGPPPGYGGPPPGGGGYGPPPGGPPPGPAPSSGSSKGPLIALMAALVVVVLLAVVGGLILATRGGDDEVELTESQRTDALLTAGDVGDGFSEIEDDDGDSPESLDASAECEEVLDRLDDEGTNPFGNDEDPPGLVDAAYADADGVTVQEGLAPTIDLVDAYRDVASACDELSYDQDGSTATVTLSEGDDPGIGDDSIRIDAEFSVEITGSEPFEFTGSIIAFTRSGTDGLVSFSAGFDADTGDPVPVDEGLIDDVVERADDRLAEVIDEA